MPRKHVPNNSKLRTDRGSYLRAEDTVSESRPSRTRRCKNICQKSTGSGLYDERKNRSRDPNRQKLIMGADGDDARALSELGLLVFKLKPSQFPNQDRRKEDKFSFEMM